MQSIIDPGSSASVFSTWTFFMGNLYSVFFLAWWWHNTGIELDHYRENLWPEICKINFTLQQDNKNAVSIRSRLYKLFFTKMARGQGITYKKQCCCCEYSYIFCWVLVFTCDAFLCSIQRDSLWLASTEHYRHWSWEKCTM